MLSKYSNRLARRLIAAQVQWVLTILRGKMTTSFWSKSVCKRRRGGLVSVDGDSRMIPGEKEAAAAAPF
jgi:hypothetical protein